MADLRPREVWRDRWLLVVDKPSGLASQPDRDGSDNVFDLARSAHPGVALHHRLDRPASGLLLLVLDPAANAPIARAFREHRVERGYRAVLFGEASAGSWTAPLGGQAARTDVTVHNHGNGLTAVSLRLHTGRTHQIRRHAALAGTPVVGDRRYGGEAGRAWPRLALHASSLALAHPITGQALTFQSPLPDDLVELWSLTLP